MNSIEELKWFESVYTAFVTEDKNLRDLFNQGKNPARYPKVHHGIWQLYETSYVYTAIKQLMKDEFPLEVSWECPYPSNNSKHADIALKNEGIITDLIEFKIWLDDKVNKFKDDIEKLASESCSKYLLIVNYGGSSSDLDEMIAIWPNTYLG